MGDVDVTAGADSDLFGLSGNVTIDYYHSNSAADGYDRLDWTTAFADGALLNPGSYLPTPVDLTIDFTSDMDYRVAGTVTGTGVVGEDDTTTTTLTDDPTDNAILNVGGVVLTGSAEFALSRYDRDLSLIHITEHTRTEMN